jgi:hypothetical protein
MTDRKPQYRVIAPYVTLKTSRTMTGSPAILGFHEGAIVPDDVSDASIAHHLARGLIVEIPEDAMPVAAPQGDAGAADPAHGGTPDPADGDADPKDGAKPDGIPDDPHAGESKEPGAGDNPAPAGSQPGAKAATGKPGGATTAGRTTAQGGRGKAT